MKFCVSTLDKSTTVVYAYFNIKRKRKNGDIGFLSGDGCYVDDGHDGEHDVPRQDVGNRLPGKEKLKFFPGFE